MFSTVRCCCVYGRSTSFPAVWITMMHHTTTTTNYHQQQQRLLRSMVGWRTIMAMTTTRSWVVPMSLPSVGFHCATTYNSIHWKQQQQQQHDSQNHHLRIHAMIHNNNKKNNNCHLGSIRWYMSHRRKLELKKGQKLLPKNKFKVEFCHSSYDLEEYAHRLRNVHEYEDRDDRLHHGIFTLKWDIHALYKLANDYYILANNPIVVYYKCFFIFRCWEIPGIILTRREFLIVFVRFGMLVQRIFRK
jgi:hypothetical protein